MRYYRTIFFWFLLLFTTFPIRSWAVTLSFLPDTSRGEIGDTIQLSGRIGPSDTLRGFTMYMVYDTNQIDLSTAPIAGSLIANRTGLDFRYSDHAGAAPNRLEIGATIFGTSFWAGPGELFVIRFVLRQCGTVIPTAEVGFRRPDASFIPGVYDPPEIVICSAPPVRPFGLTIIKSGGDSVSLHWNSVTVDMDGFPLQAPPQYWIYRQAVIGPVLPPDRIAVTSDTLYFDVFAESAAYFYFITANRTP
jgi:hypothetical protein